MFHVRLALGPWDIVLIAVVSVQATALAYVPQARWKAVLLSLPFPFTLSSLGLGRPVGPASVLGLLFLFFFTQGVRLLYVRLRVPIVPSIALAAAGYCILGALTAPILPDNDLVFWLTVAGIILLGAGLYRLLPQRDEADHRTLLPVWIKLPIVAGVILTLILMKSTLQGFMTVFPMVGTVAAYEARHSLWTMGRQIPVIMITLSSLMATSRLTWATIGLGPSLAVGWLVFLAVLLPFILSQQPGRQAPQSFHFSRR